MLFPSRTAAKRCIDFVIQRASDYGQQLSLIELVLDMSRNVSPLIKKLDPTISAVLLPEPAFPIAKQYWQHTGDGISSRRAEFCHSLFQDGILMPTTATTEYNQTKQQQEQSEDRGRYQRDGFNGAAPDAQHKTIDATSEESHESFRFIEERFGRNLDLALVELCQIRH